MPRLPVALCGLVGAALNVIAVIALREVPHTYAPGNVPAWLDETLAHPTASTVSAAAFTLGLTFLAAFVVGLASLEKSAWVWTGAALFGGGAMLDAAGTPAVIAALHVPHDVGLGLLWMTLLLDSSFNALLGLGLLCFAYGLGTDWPRPLRALGWIAGIASLPVAFQFVSDSFARWLAVAGPLWLTWIIGVCVVLMRKGKDRTA